MIQLSFTLNTDRSHLTLAIDEEGKHELAELIDETGTSYTSENEALEHLIANSELSWIAPENTGDLTDAPILGILGAPQMENSGPYGAVLCGSTEAGKEYQPILERWGYEPYQVRSFLTELLENGKATFINAW